MLYYICICCSALYSLERVSEYDLLFYGLGLHKKNNKKKKNKNNDNKYNSLYFSKK